MSIRYNNNNAIKVPTKQGGGALGAYDAGVFQALYDKIDTSDGRPLFDIIAGSHQLRMYRQLGGLQRSIEQARGELEMLNITITQKQEAITVLTDLLNRGVTESQNWC